MGKKSLIIFIFLFYLNSGKAQDFFSWQYIDRYFSLQLGTGFTGFIGDIYTKNTIQRDLSVYSVALESRLWSKVAARLDVSIYEIRGSDGLAEIGTQERTRNLSFGARNGEISLQGIFFLKKYNDKYLSRWKTDPYISVGIGVTTNKPTTQFGDNRISLRKFKTEEIAYSPVVPVIPLAMGIKWKLTEFLNFTTEIGYKLAFSDYLDDVSGIYSRSLIDPQRQAIANRNEEIPYDDLAGTIRGDTRNYDSYFQLSFRLEVFLPRKVDGAFISKPSAFKKSR